MKEELQPMKQYPKTNVSSRSEQPFLPIENPRKNYIILFYEY